MRYHLSLSVLTDDLDQHTRLYRDLAPIHFMLAGVVPSATLTSMDVALSTYDDGEYFDENTMFKVYDAIMRCGHDDLMAREIINTLQNSGILFRERRKIADDEN